MIVPERIKFMDHQFQDIISLFCYQEWESQQRKRINQEEEEAEAVEVLQEELQEEVEEEDQHMAQPMRECLEFGQTV